MSAITFILYQQNQIATTNNSNYQFRWLDFLLLKGSEVQKIDKEQYIKLLSYASDTRYGDLLVECLDYYKVLGTSELAEEQLEEFCKLKGIL